MPIDVVARGGGQHILVRQNLGDGRSPTMHLTRAEAAALIADLARALGESPPPSRSICRECGTAIHWGQHGWEHDIPAMGEWSVTAHHAARPVADGEAR